MVFFRSHEVEQSKYEHLGLKIDIEGRVPPKYRRGSAPPDWKEAMPRKVAITGAILVMRMNRNSTCRARCLLCIMILWVFNRS
jgi:hypothetical protein